MNIEEINNTTDITVLRKALLESQYLNQRLHRRSQACESAILELNKEKLSVEKDLRWVQGCYARYQARGTKLWRAVDNLPFPIDCFVKHYMNKQGL